MGRAWDMLFSPDMTSPSPHVQLLQLWEKNGYFDDSIIQQLQSPALGLGQYQVSATTSLTTPRARVDTTPAVSRSQGAHLPHLSWK